MSGRLLILGGGLWQVEYIRRARALGLETWVTDWSASAPGRAHADHFEPIDLKDKAATLALARRARVDAVMTAADIGVPTAAYVADELGLPGCDPELALAATNKFAMRRRSERAGIPVPRYRRVTSVGDAHAIGDRDLPLIVKPVDNCSSRGVRWVGSRSELAGAVSSALGASTVGEALVEQFLVGTEGSIEALAIDGRAVVLGICDKTKSPLPDRFDLELRYPGQFSARVQQDLDSLAQRIVDGFAIDNGILHIEFLVPSDGGPVHLIEFALRGCGSKVVTHLLPAMTGVDVVEAVIRQALGADVRVEPSRGRHGALHFLMFPRGRVVAVRGVDEARRLPGVVDACVERTAGDDIGEVHDGRSRPGHVLAWGETREAVQRTLAGARSLIRLDYDRATGVAPLELAVEARTE